MYKWVAKQSIEVLVVLNVDGSSPSGHPKKIAKYVDFSDLAIFILNISRIFPVLLNLTIFQSHNSETRKGQQPFVVTAPPKQTNDTIVTVILSFQLPVNRTYHQVPAWK